MKVILGSDMLVGHMVHSLFKDVFANEVHTIANVVEAARAINFLQKVFVFFVRLCVGHFKLLRIPLTEGILSLIVLHLLGNYGDRATGVIFKSHT